ncbi:hypothetical protein SDC9_126858 [bioreactor metagenome]|uniref:Uncharacterized protein n=1 Tax=bioreactor metagenome TaxID=1076179 RepID=A0A645CRU4_9ZZZZ
MILDDFDMSLLAVLEVHLVVQGRSNFSQFLVFAGLQRCHQDEIRPQRVHTLQIGLYDGAEILHLGVALVLGKEMGNVVLHHSRNGHAKLIEEVHLVHLQCRHTLRQTLDKRGTQLVVDGNRFIGVSHAGRGGQSRHAASREQELPAQRIHG